jgi:hypothetical protein
MNAHDNFDELVRNKIIHSPDKFSEKDKQELNKLSPVEVLALISIRATLHRNLGDDYLKRVSPSVAIVF